MKKQLQQVRDFNAAFNVPNGDAPRLIDPERYNLRYELLREEVTEYKAGCNAGHKENILKELCDILYVLLGTVHEQGMQDVFEAAFDEVHRSNMSKIDGATIREDGKILKGPNYKPADLSHLLDNSQ